MSEDNNNFIQYTKNMIICFRKPEKDNYQIFNSILLSMNKTNFKNLKNIPKFLIQTIVDLKTNKKHKNYIQLYNLDDKVESDYNLVFKNPTNKYFETRSFENLKDILGDDLMKFLLNNCLIFYLDIQIKNFIQIAGIDLNAEIMQKLCFKKNKHVYLPVSKTPQIYSTNAKNIYILPYQKCYIERHKIFYSINFNRKLGLFKSYYKIRSKFDLKLYNKEQKESILKINLSSKSKSPIKVDLIYNKIFANNHHLIPDCIEKKIKPYLETITNKIENYNYPKHLFYFCKLPKWYKGLKKEINQKLRSTYKEKTTNNTMYFEEVLEKLLETYINYESIYSFTRHFLLKILPKEFIGYKNLDIILDKVKIFIEMNRFEMLNYVHLFKQKEFSFNEMKWLKLKNIRYPKVEIKLKNFIMKSIISWVFDFILIIFFRSNFYVTDRQSFHFKTFYYHKNVWDIIIKINELKLKSQFLEINKLEALNSIKSYNLPCGKLRILPKVKNCRPIISYNRKIMNDNKTIKDSLINVQKIFKHIQKKMQKNYNCVVFDYNKIIKNLIDFKEKCIERSFNKNEEIRKIFKFLSLDIEGCYDNINLERLISMIEKDNNIIKDTYLLNSVYVVIPKTFMLEKLKKENVNIEEKCRFEEFFEIKKVDLVGDFSEYTTFIEYIKSEKDINYTYCVLYQDLSRNFVLKENLILDIKKYLTNNIFKFNKNFYKQVQGIPQGLPISSFLCNLYFHNIEKDLSLAVCRDPSLNLFMRFMDDYLFISENVNNSGNILLNLYDESKINDFKFNFKKSKFNFDYETKSLIIKNNCQYNELTWSGINVKMDKDNIFNIFYEKKNILEIENFNILMNINIPYNSQNDYYEILFKKISTSILIGNPWMYFLRKINNLETLKKNFLEICRNTCIKMIIITSGFFKYNLVPKQKDFINIMDCSLKKLFSYMHNKCLSIENERFFIDDLSVFIKEFYTNMYTLFEPSQKILKKYSPFFYNCLRRKMYHLKILPIINNDERIIEMSI